MSSAIPDKTRRFAADLLEKLLADAKSDGGPVEEIEAIRRVFTTLEEADRRVAAEERRPPRISGYDVTCLCGEGSFGTVWRGFDRKLEREVALKVMAPRHGGDETVVAQFLAEARSLAKIRHPNVLLIYSIVEDGELVALSTEFVNGKTLKEILAAQGPFSAAEAARVGIDLCRALAAVHAAGIVHRDVNPGNAMREDGGRIVLMDFGLGAFLGERGMVTGTPLYMAPEQATGGRVDQRTDIYALGALLYELVANRPPYDAENWTELVEKIRTQSIVPLRDCRPDVPENFVRVVARAMALSPEDRFPSAGAFESALLDVAGAGKGLGAVVDPGEMPPRGTGKRRRTKGQKWVCIALVGGALIAAALALGGLLAPATLAVQTRLFVERGNDKAIPLADGDRIEVGDLLYADIRANRDAYVYVLNRDEQGASYLLFPLDSGVLRNPLPGGAHRRLPGAIRGETGEGRWKVSSKGGTERVYVVASTAPVDALETLEAQVARGEVSAKYPLVSGDRRRLLLRGLGGVETVARDSTADVSFDEIIASIRKAPRYGRDLWVTSVELANP
jgi:eukaryotic-like serine/threonine-protein kinase